MTKTTNRRDEFLNSARLMIEGTLANPEIQSAVATFGYDPTKLNWGNTLLNQVTNLIATQKKEYGEQHTATVHLHDNWDTTHKIYMKTLRVARVALQDNTEAPRSLKLLGQRAQSLAGWLSEATVFYENLLASPEMITTMEGFGHSQETLTQEQIKVRAVAESQVNQRKEVGSAQESTQNLESKMKDLDRWVGDYRVIVKLALEERPQLLEKLGIKA